MQTFFDALPTEINVKIVRCFVTSLEHVGSGYDRYYHALAFGNGSEDRRREVIEAFSNKIAATRENLEILPELIALFGNNLHELSNLYTRRVYSNITSIPYLRTARIRARKDHLRVIKGARSLTKLHVELDNETCWNDLITTLASLPLLHLGICGKLALPPPEELHEHFYQACSNIEELVLDIYDGQNEPYWPLILRLRSLKRISFTKLLSLEDEHLMFLRALEEVELHEGPKALQHAVRIGHNVTKIVQLRLATEENVVQLSRCPNLKVIQISLEEGAERALVGKINNVLEMELRWDDRVTRAANNIEPTYYEPDGRLLLELVTSAPNLRSVTFKSAVVETKHIRRILKALGPRLVYVVVNANKQGEGEAWRITKIWKSLVTWCPNIERVKFLTCVHKANEAEIVLRSVWRKCARLEIQAIVRLCHTACSHG